jgi:hypothetical protein
VHEHGAFAIQEHEVPVGRPGEVLHERRGREGLQRQDDEPRAVGRCERFEGSG